MTTSLEILERVTWAHVMCDIAIWHSGWNLGRKIRPNSITHKLNYFVVICQWINNCNKVVKIPIKLLLSFHKLHVNLCSYMLTLWSNVKSTLDWCQRHYTIFLFYEVLIRYLNYSLILKSQSLSHTKQPSLSFSHTRSWVRVFDPDDTNSPVKFILKSGFVRRGYPISYIPMTFDP